MKLVKRNALAAVLMAAALCTRARAQAPDTTPPTVTDITADGVPLPDAILTSEPPSIVVTFSEDIDPATVSEDTFRLVRSGGDGTFDDGNEVEIVPVSVTLDGTGTQATMDLAGATRPDDEYRFRVLGNHPGWTLDFDGVNDFVSAPNSVDLGGGSFTVEAWVYLRSVGERKIVDKWNDVTGDYQFDFQVYSDGKLFLSVRPSDNSSGKRVQSVSAFPTSRWCHVAGIADASKSELGLYVDGIRQELQADPGWDGTIRSVDMEMNIGRKCTAQHYWDGFIDEVRVWNVARSEADIRDDMDRGLSGTEVGLVGYYCMDDGSGQTVSDLSPSGKHGTRGSDAATASDDPSWTASTAPLYGVTDLAGNLLDGEYSGGLPSGDTVAGGDFVCTFSVDAPPTVISTSPSDGATGVAISAAITVTFSEDMTKTATESAFSIDPSVAGTVSLAGDVLTFTPSSNLDHTTEYAVTISIDAVDLTGWALAEAYVSSFTTVDLTAPAAVTELALSPTDETIEVTWRNPSDLGLAGVVILRNAGADPTGTPAVGATYTAGETIGTDLVAYVGEGTNPLPGNKSSWLDEGLMNGETYHYAVFAFDEALNYSAGVSDSAEAGKPSDGDGSALCGAVTSGLAFWPALLAGLAGLALVRYRRVCPRHGG